MFESIEAYNESIRENIASLEQGIVQKKAEIRQLKKKLPKSLKNLNWIEEIETLSAWQRNADRLKERRYFNSIRVNSQKKKKTGELLERITELKIDIEINNKKLSSIQESDKIIDSHWEEIRHNFFTNEEIEAKKEYQIHHMQDIESQILEIESKKGELLEKVEKLTSFKITANKECYDRLARVLCSQIPIHYTLLLNKEELSSVSGKIIASLITLRNTFIAPFVVELLDEITKLSLREITDEPIQELSSRDNKLSVLESEEGIVREKIGRTYRIRLNTHKIPEKL